MEHRLLGVSLVEAIYNTPVSPIRSSTQSTLAMRAYLPEGVQGPQIINIRTQLNE
jgi:hypothetical protein